MISLKHLFAGAFLAFPLLLSADATSNRIDGVSQFLLERANDNYMYILQEQMRENDLFRCYLPQTYGFATSGGLQLLLQSGPEAWKANVEADLKNLGVQLLMAEIPPATLKEWADRLDAAYLNVLEQVRVRVDGQLYPVTSLPLNASPALRNAVNAFYDDYLDAREEIRGVIAKEAATQAVSDRCPAAGYGTVAIQLEKLGNALEKLKSQMDAFQGSDLVWNGAAEGGEYGAMFKEALMPLEMKSGKLAYYKGQIGQILKEPSLVLQMHRLDVLIRFSIDQGENPLVNARNMEEYDRFVRYALSFAMLSEAESVDQVKSVMSQLTLPPVSFAQKRKTGLRTFMITAYFGIHGGVETLPGGEQNGFGGLTVPVGFEYNWGMKSGVVSLMLAPLEFAHPVNRLLNSEEGEARLKDIVNPGVYLSYGLKKLPIVMGVNYSRGTSLTGGTDPEENRERYGLFFAMDMPLFNLY